MQLHPGYAMRVNLLKLCTAAIIINVTSVAISNKQLLFLQQQQQERIVVQVSKALAYEPTAAGVPRLSHVAQQHGHDVSCSYQPSLQDCMPPPPKQPQQQFRWLGPAEYPRLHPALKAGNQRL